MLPGQDKTDSFATPFELWCEEVRLHPEDSRVWDLYLAQVAVWATRAS